MPEKKQPEIFQYISGILNKLGQYPLAVNGYKDHVHLFFELQPKNSLSEIVRIVKASSSKWINENQIIQSDFSWQSGYGGFSYARSQRNRVIQYIMSQKEHHQKMTFREEYLKLLRLFEIQFSEQYIFDFYE
jgi:putative transposase